MTNLPQSSIASKRPGPILLTGSAAKKVQSLIQEEGNPALKLRVFIQGGGCSGYQYGFTFDEETDEGDTIIHYPLKLALEDAEKLKGFVLDAAPEASDVLDTVAAAVVEKEDALPEDLRLLVDPMSYQYLVGAEIDYKDDINGAQFVIKNPNASTTCGCGSSFSA